MVNHAHKLIVDYIQNNPGQKGTQIARGLSCRLDWLYPKLKELQEVGDIRKKGNTSNSAFYTLGGRS